MWTVTIKNLGHVWWKLNSGAVMCKQVNWLILAGIIIWLGIMECAVQSVLYSIFKLEVQSAATLIMWVSYSTWLTERLPVHGVVMAKVQLPLV